MKKALFVVVLLVVVSTVYWYFAYSTAEFVPDVRTATVTQGDIVDTVGATGVLEAVTTVNVGSQVSGIIDELYVDFNSIIREGDVIMRLDPSLFETQVEQARANLVRAEADTERLRVSLDDAKVQHKRAEDLAARQLISDTELEAAQLAVRSSEAQLKSSEAGITQARASLNQNEVNLEHTIIRSPIDGIVISRLVDVGQTVAASLQAPELFVIAADLTKMRVIANIDESDVGRIRPNQRVTFTVDAFPGEEFEGLVSQIRLNPVVTQNVVTYATVVDSPNPDLRLKPGMTATISLETARRENVLRIPNTALRFRPTNAMFAVLGQPVPKSMQLGDSAAQNVHVVPSTTFSEGEGDNLAAGTRGAGQFGGGGNGFGGGGAPDPERMRRFQERLVQMMPEEREQFEARRAARLSGGARFVGDGGRRPSGVERPANASSGPNIPAVERGATTIDVLFGTLPVTETTGQVWAMDGGRLRQINVRLGVTDGRATELLGVLRVPDAAPVQRRATNPQVELLRERITTIEDETVRGTLARTIDQIESSSSESLQLRPSSVSRLSLEPGTTLVTNITTPDNGSSSQSGSSGSPLILQFGRRR